MNQLRPSFPVGGFLIGFAIFLSACVTINIYFPAAAAEKAAEKIVEDVLSTGDPNIRKAPEKDSKGDDRSGGLFDQEFDKDGNGVLVSVLDWFIPVANAEPDFDVDTPAIRQIQARMRARNRDLSPFYKSGAAGFGNDGMVKVRDKSAVGLKQRAKFNKLIKAENADRKALYAEIAKANGHPEWEPEVRAVFAKTWVDRAQRGWWVQDANGSWRQR